MEHIYTKDLTIHINLVNPIDKKVSAHIVVINYVKKDLIFDFIFTLRDHKRLNLLKLERGHYLCCCDLYYKNIKVSSQSELVFVSKPSTILKPIRKLVGWKRLD